MAAHQIRIGHLIDGSGGPIQKNVTLSVSAGNICALASEIQKGVLHGQGEGVDLSFATVVPPFVDCSASLALSGTVNSDFRLQQQAMSAESAAPLIGRHLVYLFRHGVLAVYDGDPRWSGGFKNMTFANEPVLIRSSKPSKPGGLIRADGEVPVKMAVESGCRAIIGGEAMGQDNLKRLADLGITWVPMLFALKTSEQHAFAMEPGKQSMNRFAHQMEQVALAREMGLRVAVGTGAGSRGILHGEAMVEELKLLLKAGYSLSEAVCCATHHGAQLLDSESGLLAVGKPATFLVARGTPAQLPRKFAYLEAIYIDGTPSSLYRKNPIRGVF